MFRKPLEPKDLHLDQQKSGESTLADVWVQEGQVLPHTETGTILCRMVPAK